MILYKILILFVILSGALPGYALGQDISSPSAALPDLTGQQKSILLMIAREAIEATIEGRDSREATVEPRLTIAQPMVVSVYIDGELRARAWALKTAQPLYLLARSLTYQAIDQPKVSDKAISPEELSKAEISIAVLSNYTRAKDETEIPPKSAVIVYYKFTEWMALPGDVKSDKAADLLSYACEQAGLRPHVWLLSETAIFQAKVEETREARKVN